MRKLPAALVCLFLSAAAFSEGEWESEASQGSGVRQLDFAGFTAVETSYGIDVKIVQSQSYSVTLFADPDVIDRILVETYGRTLRIDVRREFLWFGRPMGRKARVEIQMPDLEGLGASGGSRLDVDMDAGAGGLLVRLSGGSSFRGDVHAGDMEINGSGGSSAELTGGCGRLRLHGSGGGFYGLFDFTARELEAELSGGSAVEASVTDVVSVRGSGGSHVVYRGNARIERQQLSGGSWIRRD